MVLVAIFAGSQVSGDVPDHLVWLRLPSAYSPEYATCLADLDQNGWKVRTRFDWENLVAAHAPQPLTPVPICAIPVGAVARGIRPIPPQRRPPEGLARIVDPTLELEILLANLGVAAAHEALARRGQAPGSGVRIAVIDGGFALGHEALRSLRSQGRIVDHWDFVDGDPHPWDDLAPLRSDFEHGLSVTALLASDWSRLPGILPAAEYLLYRSEREQGESLSEEDLLVAAIVRAVDSGAQVISISLGYRWFFDDGPSPEFREFDGRTRPSSLAALGAARRGVVVVAAAGNDAMLGASSFGAPADADSILTVGAVSPQGIACGFSSSGFTADGRPKPEVVAYGCPVPVATTDGLESISSTGSGTSFAAPLVAGLAGLILQWDPELRADEVRRILMQSGERAFSPDAVIGAGLPDLRRALDLTSQTPRNLPALWDPLRGGLRFWGNPGDRPGPLELSLIDLDGTLRVRWSLPRHVPGAALRFDRIPPTGVYIAIWRTTEGVRSQRILLTPGGS